MEREIDALASKLEDANLDIKSKVQTATDLRDSIDRWSQSSTYPASLQRLVPIWLSILDGQPSFMSTSPDHKLRNLILEIIHRLPMSSPENLEPHAVLIVDKLLALIRIENEDNAILCVKIIMDLQRQQTKVLASKVQPFLDLIREIFEGMEQVVKDTFSPSNNATAPTLPNGISTAQSLRPGSPAMQQHEPGQEQQPARPLQKGMQSFAVMAELPIVVVSIFQAYKDVVQENVTRFAPLIKKVLLLQAGPQERAHKEAEARGTIHTSVAKEIKNKAAFAAFVLSQVKIMSFLAYVLRVYGQKLQDFLVTIPEVVVRLLRDCPKEKCSTRKELLVAIRHIINFNFRKIFLKWIEALLDERTLLGDGLAVQETLKPLAYSLLADLIHHVRDSLTVDQIRATVRVYTRNLRESFPSTSFQTMSAKLLLNMADSISKIDDKREARYFLMSILDAIAEKFAALNRQYPNAVKVSANASQQPAEPSSADYLADPDRPPDWDETDIFCTAPIKISHPPRERVNDPMTENKFLFKNLVGGLKSVIYNIRTCSSSTEVEEANAPHNWKDLASGFSPEEIEILIKIFHEGVSIFRYYDGEKPPSKTNTSTADVLASHHVMAGTEEKNLLETFATVFHHIDPAVFHEVFHSQIPHLYEMMFEHPALVHIPQFLLASEATSPNFAGMLLQFLMDRIGDVGSADVDKATILLRLFKLAFMAVTLFSQHNELVLLPHVNKLVTQSIKLSTTAEAPMHYFFLLRSLFRSIGGGRFEHLYKEILPLLEMLLEFLNNLIVAAQKRHERDLYVELSLTVPARLSNLLPHLSYLMKPLVLALRAGTDLVGQGLRTLELCVDNLTADYLDPIMAPVIDDLMAALWDHLKPNPYSIFHAHTTMRILGKLGGRNRKFLEGPPKSAFEKYVDGPAKYELRLQSASKPSTMKALLGTRPAIAKLHEVPKSPSSKTRETEKENEIFYKKQALRLLLAQIKMFANIETFPHGFEKAIRLQVNDLMEGKWGKSVNLTSGQDREKSITKKYEQQNVLKDMIKACMFATSIPELAEEANTFLKGLYRHFTLIEIGRTFEQGNADRKEFSIDAGESELNLDSTVLIDSIVESLAADQGEVRDAAVAAIHAVYDAAAIIFESKSKVVNIPWFLNLMMACCHSCYQEEWFSKSGGSLGIKILSSEIDLGIEWLTKIEPSVCRALMYAAKDLPEDLPETTRVQALDTLSLVLRKCNENSLKNETGKEKAKSLASLFILDLAHTSRHVRQAAQDALSKLAEYSGSQVHEFVAPAKGRLLMHVFNKPLRALPFAIQIGYIEAVSYCLKLQNGVLEVNEGTNRFIKEAIQLAEQDDDSFALNRSLDQRNLEYIIKLRVACLKLLSMALDLPEFVSSPTNKARPKIISVFFKQLYAKSPEVVSAADEALKAVVERDPKLPKDVLQAGLRPVLVSLQNPSSLKVDVLECLARLLQLLKSYFKVEIGARLLDNIKHITDALTLQKASFVLIEQHDRVTLVAAILNIFHLLPPGAKDFLDRLVTTVLELESQLRRSRFSPFRAPIVKYLNKYPQEAWEHFSRDRLKDRTQGRFFAQIVADPGSTAIRSTISESGDRLLEAINSASPGNERRVVFINVLEIVHALLAYPEARRPILGGEALRKLLIEEGKLLNRDLQQNAVPIELRLASEQACQGLMSALTTYLADNTKDLDSLFSIIQAVSTEALQDSSKLYALLYSSYISSDDSERQKAIVTRSIEIFVSKAQNEPYKTFVMHNLVNPILAKDVMRNWSTIFGSKKGTALVDKNLMNFFSVKLWQPQSNMETAHDEAPQWIDQSRIELLQMTAMVLKYHNALMAEQPQTQRSVIHFSWSWVRLEDVINKHAAYVVLAYFVALFDTTPAKVAFPTYSALLTSQNAHAEARPLVVQALEILAPVIPKRLNVTEGKMPVWARLARRSIVEDPSNLQQILSIFQFVARHPDLFYDAKEPLAQTIITSIHKVAQLPSPSMESKRNALSLVTLIWNWEQRYVNDPATPKSPKRKADGEEVSVRKNRSFISSVSLRMMLIKYLVQFIASLPDRFPVPSAKEKIERHGHYSSSQLQQSADICRRAITLFHNFLSPEYWSDLDIDTMFPKITEPILTNEPKEEKYDITITRIVNMLQLLSVMVNVKPDDWVAARLVQLQKLLEKPIRNANPEVQDCLYAEDTEDTEMNRKPLILRIAEALPKPSTEEDLPDADAPEADFITLMNTVAAEALPTSNNLAGVNILTVFAKTKPEEIDQHVKLIMKTLGHLHKEHLSPQALQTQVQAMTQGTRSAETPADLGQIEAQCSVIIKIIDILAARIVQLGEERRPYLAVLTQLVEKSPNTKICMKILDIVNQWVFKSGNQVFPTLKEKTAVIIKMLAFEHRPDPVLFNRFLETIISVYEDDKITRSELAIRLEPAFLVGMRASTISMRERFVGLFDRHLTRSASKRLLYLLTAQNWDTLADSFWLNQVIELLFGSIDMDRPARLSVETDFRLPSVTKLFQSASQDPRISEIKSDVQLEALMAAHSKFCSHNAEVPVRSILQPLCYLQHLDGATASSIWSELFPMFWQVLSKDERTELQTGMISLMTRDFHQRGLEKRPNCVQALLEGVARAQHPRMNFPHHLMKFLARTYNAWYIATSFMEQNTIEPIVNTPAVRESNQDALAETYAGLEEGDLFYGLWRRRCQYLDTNTALSYEQHGNWEKAQRTFEAATMKARTGAVPFSQGEYMLWEDHWVLCAQKLQQWDILTDFAKMDNLNDLYLDSVWRNFEMWNNPEQRKQLDSVIKSVQDAPTPRRSFFNAFMSLLQLHNDQQPPTAFNKLCEEATQLSIRKWHQLPESITNAHIPILQHFQQLVELHDAHSICGSLASTNQSNLDQKAPELKLLLGTWRDRLPNFWDDINAWQDLVTWRRHVFQMINNKYLGLIPQTQNGGAGNSFAYRGYHETAWTINKFAHVARKHNLSEVCISQLSTIYTLPNIEIQEAFLKLREQAKCHLQNGTSTELQAGLDVINNTNLNYFGQQQKAEFYTLKGMFLTKQNQLEEANEAFGSALYFDLKLPKAWAEWARYNEHLFKQNPSDMSKAAAAVSCYLEAAGTYKNAKSRKALSRILWLLSLDDAQGQLTKAFTDYKGDTPSWYWITFIPQLLWSLSRPEAKIACDILNKLAKAYPQALYYHLRTTREDQLVIKRQHEQKEQQARAKQQGSPQQAQQQHGSTPSTTEGQAENAQRPTTSNSDSAANSAMKTEPKVEPKTEPNGDTATQSSPNAPGQQGNATQGGQSNQPSTPKRSWEYVEEIVSTLKTAFPLLALSMETMVDLISRNFKCPPDEEGYRLITALLNDAESYVTRSPLQYAPGAKLPPHTETNVARFAENVLPPSVRKPFEADLVVEKPDLYQYITRLRKWRDRFEERLDRRAPHSNLEAHGPSLSEFKFQKFDEVEVPGQYMPHRDSNKDFIRIERFLPDVDLTRGHGVCYRRLKIRGHDGSLHPFIIQHPAPRTTRREERMLQLFRFFNDTLAKKKESRRRKLQFTLPVQVLLAPAVRMVQDDPSQISLQGIWEDHCRRTGLSKDEPILSLVSRLRELAPKSAEQAAQIRQQAHEHIQSKMCPPTIVTDFFAGTYSSFGDFWMFRRQFSYQLASLSFMTYIMFMKDRTPSRMSISRATGNIWGTDLVLSMMQSSQGPGQSGGPGPRLHTNEAVPWRLTPNLQMLMGPIALEGIFSASMMVIAKALTEPEQKLDSYLSLFLRDEVFMFYTSQRNSSQPPPQLNATALRDAVQKNSELVVNRAQAVAKEPQGTLPANQTVVDLVSKATNPAKLSQMDALWMGYL